MSNTQIPSLTYNGIVITFNEQHERWEFTLDGRERFSAKLSGAKAAIDAPPKEKKKPFEQIEAWWGAYGGDYQKVRVTSLCEGSSKDYGYFWIVYNQGSRLQETNRSKVDRRQLFAVNEKNDALIAEMKRLNEERAKLREQIEKAASKLTNIPFPES